jgi:hypothetical protein
VSLPLRKSKSSSISRSERKRLNALQAQAKRIRRIAVRILNPLPGGTTHTSLEAAVRHVARGAAEWVTAAGGERCIEFGGHQRAAAERTQREIHSTLATDGEMKQLPLLKPREMLAPSPRRHFWSKSSVDPRFRASDVNKPHVPRKVEE